MPKNQKKNHSYIRININPETAKIISAISLFALGSIFILAYFHLAGPAGDFLRNIFSFLMGWGYFLLPTFIFLGAFSLIKGIPENGFILLVGLAVAVISILGLSHQVFPNQAGFVGSVVGSAVGFLFGFWASILVLVTLGICGIALAFYPRNRSISQPTQEIKKEPDLPQPNISTEIRPKTASTPEEASRFRQKLVREEAEENILLSTKKFLKEWDLPPLDLLEADDSTPSAGDVRINANIIKRTLENFGIPVEMAEVNIGPTVTQYTLKPAQGVKLAKIVALQNDLALALAAHPIRIEAPIPGKSLVGIEVPNKSAAVVRMRTLFADSNFMAERSPLSFLLGRDVLGSPVIADLSRMPHLLIAGATGSGKSIFIHSILMSFLFRNPPHILRFILIDPKRVELSQYQGIPHLLTPVIVEGKKALSVLRWAISEMDRRYAILLGAHCRDIFAYNVSRKDSPNEIMPFIVIIIDELADLMAAFGREVEGAIVRLAQMARATGIHLIVSTQRPSVDVITGLIKANITSRVAFQVASQADSRTILDMAGAEKLLGFGDMLFLAPDASKPRRIQAPFVSEREIKRVVEFLVKQGEELGQMPTKDLSSENFDSIISEKKEEDTEDLLEDPLYEDAVKVVREAKKASASLLQRRLKIGYARAARLLDIMEAKGIVGPADGAKPREVYGISQANTENEKI